MKEGDIKTETKQSAPEKVSTPPPPSRHKANEKNSKEKEYIDKLEERLETWTDIALKQEERIQELEKQKAELQEKVFDIESEIKFKIKANSERIKHSKDETVVANSEVRLKILQELLQFTKQDKRGSIPQNNECKGESGPHIRAKAGSQVPDRPDARY